MNVPVIASGGAGTADHIAAGLTDGGASAAIISSILYSPRLDRNLGVRELKDALGERGVPMRPWVETRSRRALTADRAADELGSQAMRGASVQSRSSA